MECTSRVPGVLAAVALAASALLSQAQAAPVLTVALTPGTAVAPPGAVVADIFVSGLTDAIGGFDFNLGYNAALVTFTSFTPDPDNKMGDGGANAILDFSAGDNGLRVNFATLAGFIDEPTAAGLQLPGFRLGTASFTADVGSSGIASFTLSTFSLSSFDGLGTLDGVTARGAEICVLPVGATSCDNGGNTNIPEPATGLLLAVAFSGLAAVRRKQQAA